jgi:hypothetical protein
MVQFSGMEPWPENMEVIECVVDGVVVDLHNDATLTSIEILCRPVVELVLRFTHDDGRRAALTFGAVTDLRFVQDERDGTSEFASGWDPERDETFYGAEFHGRGGEVGEFTVNTITGTLTFACSRVAFEIQPASR